MKPIVALLIANRGEIAVRIARAAAALEIRSVAAHSEDDVRSSHLSFADEAIALPGRGAAAYLDIDAIVAAAVGAGCDAIHPGYGFLSENAEFARACANAGIKFVGPSPDSLSMFGDKAAARQLAETLDVPLLPGTGAKATCEVVNEFMASLPGGSTIMLKAVAGGGGRGMRVVSDPVTLEDAFASCVAEAEKAFGCGDLYAELMVARARHVEIQVIGDGRGGIVHLGDRECTLQRRHQKLIEITPSPSLPAATRALLCEAAIRMATAVEYEGLATIEFLVDATDATRYWFMEANPRVQVEHTITEEVSGVDLVQAQIRIAGGAMLADLGLEHGDRYSPTGFAIQLRINAESIGANGHLRPATGVISNYEMPFGPNVRIDGYARQGAELNPNFDSLLAKLVIVQRGPTDAANYQKLIAAAQRALRECRVGGVATNLSFLSALLASDAVIHDQVYTGYVEENLADLARDAAQIAEMTAAEHSDERSSGGRVGPDAPAGTTAIVAPMSGLVASFYVEQGDWVEAGQLLGIVEAMKMENPILAPFAGEVMLLAVASGSIVQEGQALIFVDSAGHTPADSSGADDIDLEYIPPTLAKEMARRRLRMDEARPEAVARRRETGQRTIRENIDALCDAESFVEYGGLALPSQRQRRSSEELIAMGPADGLVGGSATVNAAVFPDDASRCIVVGYDYTAFAGTQGWANHKKLDRLFRIARKNPLPLFVFTEGGGGRPGETDQMRASGLDSTTFANFARLSGRAPLIGIVSGRCFAGNAALLGCCDVIIATRDATIGMGGPAMIEGGGLGKFAAQEIGPVSMQILNGVVDITVLDEREAVEAARKYVGYFQGALGDWRCADQRLLRHLVPENHQRVYDVRRVLDTLTDEGSVLELRPEFGRGLITALARIEGRAVGMIANDSRQLGGALDSTASDKGARFLRLCELFGLPVVSICDTPGFMVGPESERTAAVRHMSRLFLAGANLTVPLVTVVLRKGFGLGAMAMAGGGTHEPVLTVAWPTAQFGAMGIEGGVRLGFRRELAAISDPQEREALFNELVAKAYEDGKAYNAAGFVEIDDVIDPAETRSIIARTLKNQPPCPKNRSGQYLDSW